MALYGSPVIFRIFDALTLTQRQPAGPVWRLPGVASLLVPGKGAVDLGDRDWVISGSDFVRNRSALTEVQAVLFIRCWRMVEHEGCFDFVLTAQFRDALTLIGKSLGANRFRVANIPQSAQAFV